MISELSIFGVMSVLALWIAYSWRRQKALPASVATSTIEKPQPPVPLQGAELDSFLRRIYASRAAGWDLHWDVYGGSSGALVDRKTMTLKLAAERRMHELAAQEEADDPTSETPSRDL